MKTFLILAAVFLGSVSAFAGDIHGTYEYHPDRFAYHWINIASVNARVVFNLSYEYKCGETYAQWQRFSEQQQTVYINAHSDTYTVNPYPPCSTATQLQNLQIDVLSTTQSN